MGYRIEYDSRVGKYEIRRDRKEFFVFTICAVVVALGAFLSGGLRPFLIPGTDTVTVQAFHVMTDDLRSGACLREAILDFCKLVIQGG